MLSKAYIGKNNKLIMIPEDFKNINSLLKKTEDEDIIISDMDEEQVENYVAFLGFFYDKVRDKYVFSDLKEEEYFTIISKYDYADLVIMANILDNKIVLDLCCKYIVSLIKGKNSSEIRELFRPNIV